MSLFKRMFASMGVGSAKVDLMLYQDTIQAGGMVNGVVRIAGGQVTQQIDDVYAYVMTKYIRERNDAKMLENGVIAKFLLAGKFTLEARQIHEFPVSFQLPAITPATMERTPVWIQTGLDINNAIDPTDQDYIKVLPHPHSSVVLQAVNRLGFRLREVSCEYAPRYARGGMSFVQEFEFVPTTNYRNQLDELEIIFYPDERGVELLLQIDRKSRGFFGALAEAMDVDESFVHVRFEQQHLAQGVDYIANELNNFIFRYV